MSRFDTDKFDMMLGQALKKHSEAVPVDFTSRMMTQIEESCRQKMLAQVILRERLALAACVAVAVLTVFVAVVLPGAAAGVFDRVAAGLVDQGRTLAEQLPQTAKTVSGAWRLIMVIGAAAGFCIYGLVDLLFGDRLRMV